MSGKQIIIAHIDQSKTALYYAILLVLRATTPAAKEGDGSE